MLFILSIKFQIELLRINNDGWKLSLKEHYNTLFKPILLWMKKDFVPMAVYYLSIQRLLETILGRITVQTHSSLNNNKDSNHLMSFICIHRECMYYILLQVSRP